MDLFLLKAKAILHGIIFLFSFGMSITMLVEAKTAIFPPVFCYICAVVSIINVVYSAWLLVDCNKAIEEAEAKERR